MGRLAHLGESLTGTITGGLVWTGDWVESISASLSQELMSEAVVDMLSSCAVFLLDVGEAMYCLGLMGTGGTAVMSPLDDLVDPDEETRTSLKGELGKLFIVAEVVVVMSFSRGGGDGLAAM